METFDYWEYDGLKVVSHMELYSCDSNEINLLLLDIYILSFF